MKSSFLAAVVLAGFAITASAQTRLEGEYQFIVDVRKQDRNFDWDFDSNNNDTFNQVELRLLSNPHPSVEMFLRTGAEWNRDTNRNERPKLQFREAHIKFRREFGHRGFESYLFSRQNRYWVDNQLIQVVQDFGGGNGQGIRFDTWGWLGLRTALIYSDFSGTCLPAGQTLNGANRCDPERSAMTDDAYVVRVWRPFLEDQLRVGFTYNRKNELEDGDLDPPVSQDGEPDEEILKHTEVFAADLRLTLFNIDYRLEVARGRDNTLDERIATSAFPDEPLDVPTDALDWNLSRFRFGDPQAAIPDDIVIRGEARAWRFGTPKYGFFNLAPSFWILGPQFRNQLGDGNNDERGYEINSWYLLPGKAITLTTNWKEYRKEFFQNRKVTEFYEEMWTEYVNGFTTKFSYRRRRTEDINQETEEKIIEKNDDFFGELVVENELAWLRIQGLIKDISTPLKKDLLSVETSVNITSKIKIYNRFGFGNDPGRQRKVLFSELQYRPTDNVELFLAYGPFWVGGGSNPVFEGNLQSGGDQKDLVRLTMKGNF